MLRDRLGKMVYIDNESNLCAVSRHQRPDEKSDDIVYVFADEGLGVGVVTGGMLVTGSCGYAPEICHIPIGNPNLKCRLCGNYGCVESDLQIEGYIRKYNLNSSGNIGDLKTFRQSIQKADAVAREVLEENVQIMGALLSILNNMFNPDVIYIGGETSDFFSAYVDELKRSVASRAIASERTLPRIELDMDCDRTVLCGAAEMVVTRWMPEI